MKKNWPVSKKTDAEWNSMNVTKMNVLYKFSTMWIEVVGLMYYDAHHLHNLLLGPRASPGMISHHHAVEISWSLDTVMADTMSSRCNYVGCDQ